MNLTQQNIPRSKHKRANVDTLLVTYLTDKGLSDRAQRKCKLRVSAASSQSPKPEHLTAWRGQRKPRGGVSAASAKPQAQAPSEPLSLPAQLPQDTLGGTAGRTCPRRSAGTQPRASTRISAQPSPGSGLWDGSHGPPLRAPPRTRCTERLPPASAEEHTHKDQAWPPRRENRARRAYTALTRQSQV